jgi:hypothetical protein
MFKSSVTSHWHVSYKKNMPVTSTIILHQSAMTTLQTFSMFTSRQPVEGWPECSLSSIKVVSHLKQVTYSKICSPHGITTKTAFSISCISLKSATQKSQITHTQNKHPLTNADGYGGNLTRWTQNTVTLQHLVADRCTTCCSVPAASSWTFIYAFVHTFSYNFDLHSQAALCETVITTQ